MRMFIMAVAVFFSASASANDFVYTPVNPSFGGSPLNSSHLLGIANAQNDNEKPKDEQSQAELFARQLQSRLYSALAGKITDAIFGEDAQDTGRVVLDGQVISWERGLETVRLVITDEASGGETVIEVPVTISLQQGY